MFSASQRQQANFTEGMFLHRWFAILNVCNLLTRQDEVLSLTPNVGLFFIVQIVNSSTNHNIRFVIDLFPPNRGIQISTTPSNVR